MRCLQYTALSAMVLATGFRVSAQSSWNDQPHRPTQPSQVDGQGQTNPPCCSNHSNLKPKMHRIILLLPANCFAGSLQTREDLHI
jgi:hypothetical protein